MHDWSTLHFIRKSQAGLKVAPHDDRGVLHDRPSLGSEITPISASGFVCAVLRIPLTVVQGPRCRFRPRVCGGKVQLGLEV